MGFASVVLKHDSLSHTVLCRILKTLRLNQATLSENTINNTMFYNHIRYTHDRCAPNSDTLIPSISAKYTFGTFSACQVGTIFRNDTADDIVLHRD